MFGDELDVGLRLTQRTDDRAMAPPRLRMGVRRLAVSAALLLGVLLPQATVAQQNAPQPSPAPQSQWAKLPRMQLEQQFAGPLQDTIIQVWRDPGDGALCYIYLPITVEHSQSGYVQYGANTVGSLSCLMPPRTSGVSTRSTRRPLALHH
jgi:hypothetical protein